MFKKSVSMILSISVLLSCFCFTANAATTVIAESDTLDLLLEQAIYEQLESQGKLDTLDTHLEIHQALNSSKVVPYGDDDEYVNVYAPHGGVLQYEKWKPSPSTYVGVTYLNRDDTLYYVFSAQELKVEDVVLSVLGYVPIVGALASAYSNAVAVVTSGTATSIKNAGGYAQIVTSTGEYQGESTTASGWTKYPYMYLNEDYVKEVDCKMKLDT